MRYNIEVVVNLRDGDGDSLSDYVRTEVFASIKGGLHCLIKSGLIDGSIPHLEDDFITVDYVEIGRIEREY